MTNMMPVSGARTAAVKRAAMSVTAYETGSPAMLGDKCWIARTVRRGTHLTLIICIAIQLPRLEIKPEAPRIGLGIERKRIIAQTAAGVPTKRSIPV